MPIHDYYFSRKAVPRFGKLYFLKVLHEASSEGGGRSLLGSVVQELRDGLFGLGQHYPVPLHLSKPGIVRDAMEKHKEHLGLDAGDRIVLSQKLAATQQSLVIKRKESFGAGVGPFPSLPGNFGLDIDYSLMRQGDAGLRQEHAIRVYPARLFRQAVPVCAWGRPEGGSQRGHRGQ